MYVLWCVLSVWKNTGMRMMCSVFFCFFSWTELFLQSGAAALTDEVKVLRTLTGKLFNSLHATLSHARFFVFFSHSCMPCTELQNLVKMAL